MIESLKGIVKVRTSSTREVGTFYINDLPGISEKFLQLLTTLDDTLMSQLWEKVEIRGINTFYQDVVAKYAEGDLQKRKFSLKNVAKDIVSGTIITPHESVPINNVYAGVQLYLTNSENLELHLQTIQIYNDSGAAVSSSFKIFDLETGEELDNIPFEVQANSWLVVNIHRKYLANMILVAYDRNALISRKTKQSSLGYYHGICQSCKGVLTQGKFVTVSKASVLESETVNDSLGGMVVKFAVNCTLEDFLSRNRSYINQTLAYNLALELFIEMVGSDRINTSTGISQEEYGILIEYFESRYQTGISNFVKSFPLKDTICVDSVEPIKRAVFHP